MKKALSLALALTVILSVMLTAVSCKKDDVPDGMQTVMGGEDIGYYFYGPEEWVIANVGNIACTYASRIDTSSMTFAETKMPEGSIEEYFEAEKTKFPYEITVETNGESVFFGNADKPAVKYTYTYSYKESSYGCMQIFVTHGDRFYIFTYTASTESRADGNSYYSYYLEKVENTIKSFKFTVKNGSTGSTPEYERDADGYILVSDKSISGFKLYVPDSYHVSLATSVSSVSRDDGTTITVASPTYPATSAEDYWEKRHDDIVRIADKGLDENGASVTTLEVITENKRIELSNCDVAAEFEYKYVLDGVTQHIYQVVVRAGRDNYVFTYISREDSYLLHLDEAKRILEKIEF